MSDRAIIIASGAGAMVQEGLNAAQQAAVAHGDGPLLDGLAGGAPGATGRNYVERSDGRIEPLGPFDQAEMAAGDVFVIETPGGGGFGTP